MVSGVNVSQVHDQGVSLIGAHTMVRPATESYPYNWTHHDDCIAMMNFMMHARIDMSKILSEIRSPEEAPEVYRQLAENKDFPVWIVFDWSKISG